jgi:trimeric autotransporter adhesin
VDAAGTVGGTTQVTTGPLPEEQPELAPIPGTPGAALLAYSALDPTTYRIALQAVGASGGTQPPPPPPPASAVASLTLNPASVVGGKGSVATVTLAQPAPAGGAKVMLSSANVNVATVPVSVLVSAGTTSKTFTVTSKPVASTAMVGITATYSGASKTAVLTVDPPVLSGLTLSPATIAGGCQGSTGKVTLSGKAPIGGLVVPLTNTNPAASVPASVTVPAGATYVTFPVTAPAVAAIQTGTVSASFGGVTRSVTLKVRPIGLASLTLAPNPVVGPNAVTGTVTLECPAAPGSVVVALSSSTLSVAKPAVASVTIPAGSTTATFTVTTADVSAVSYATIKAVAGGVTKTVRLTVNP